MITEIPADAIVIIDILLGLSIVYLGLSMIASALLEMVANLVKLRARYLKVVLTRLFNDKTGTLFTPCEKDSLAALFMQHSLVKPLHSESSRVKNLLSFREGPAYLSSELFAKVAINTVKQDNQDACLQQAIEKGMKHKPSPFYGTLSSLVQESSCEKSLEESLKNWYDEVMVRASGSYKRLSQKMLFVIGLALAIVLNVDSLQYAKTFKNDGLLRELAVEQAKSISTSGKFETPLELSMKVKQSDACCKNSSDCCESDQNRSSWLSFFGWFLTALAISMGAPYWLQTVRMLSALRSSIPTPTPKQVPEKNPTDEPSGTRDTRQASIGSPQQLDFAELSTEEVRDVQLLLDMDSKQLSGKMDVNTRAAIRKWQEASGYLVTGFLTQQQYASLRGFG